MACFDGAREKGTIRYFEGRKILVEVAYIDGAREKGTKRYFERREILVEMACFEGSTRKIKFFFLVEV